MGHSFTIDCDLASICIGIDGCGCAAGDINVFVVTELTGFPWGVSSDVKDVVHTHISFLPWEHFI